MAERAYSRPDTMTAVGTSGYRDGAFAALCLLATSLQFGGALDQRSNAAKTEYRKHDAQDDNHFRRQTT
jgi:hypothetical protein